MTNTIDGGLQGCLDNAIPDQRPRCVLGLHGPPGSGKDTIAKILARFGFQRVSFADPLRAMLYALNPLTSVGVRVAELVDLVGWEQAKKTGDVRELLQRMGTEAVRECIGQDTWIELARQKIAQATGPVVVTDVRFANEGELIGTLGGLVYAVRRPGVTTVNNHASERYDLPTAGEIANESLEGLIAACTRLARDLGVVADN